MLMCPAHDSVDAPGCEQALGDWAPDPPSAGAAAAAHAALPPASVGAPAGGAIQALAPPPPEVRARNHFLRVAAHELRTPVTTIAGYVALLRGEHERGRLDAERLGVYLEQLTEASDRLMALTRELTEAACARRRRLAVRPRPLDLAALLGTATGRWRARLGPRHRLDLAGLGGPLWAQADPERLERLFDHLLENAVKFSPQGGAILVAMEAPPGAAMVRVRDEGIGLPPADVEAIFEPFGRAANAERRVLPGLGLGLATARAIAEAHGGRLWAESPGEDRGSTFSLWLPGAGACP